MTTAEPGQTCLSARDIIARVRATAADLREHPRDVRAAMNYASALNDLQQRPLLALELAAEHFQSPPGWPGLVPDPMARAKSPKDPTGESGE
jgi:hypothetical protein